MTAPPDHRYSRGDPRASCGPRPAHPARHDWITLKLYDLTQSRMMRRTAGWAVGAGVAEGAALAFVADALVPAAGAATLIVVAFAGALGLAVPILAAGFLLYEVRESTRRTRKLVQIRPLMGALPLPVGGWAMEPDLGDLIARIIHDRRPRLIVECGSGSSTVLAASVLRILGHGRLISLEHEPEFAERTREALAERDLCGWAEVVTAPLAPRQVDGIERIWYDVDIAGRIPDGIDLLVVDGPPKGVAKLSRFPAVPLLRSRMAPGCVVLLDDGNRPDERQTAGLWEKVLGVDGRHASDGKGSWVFTTPGTI